MTKTFKNRQVISAAFFKQGIFICAIVLIVFSATSCTAQLEKQTYTRLYDLHFSMQPDSTVIYPWLENAAYSNYSTPDYIQDSNRKLFARRFFEGFPFCDRLRTEYEQRVLLPRKNIKEAVVEFEGKGDHIKLVSIILDAIDEQENILFSDTLQYKPDSVLRSVSKNIRLIHAAMLNIRIHAEGEINKDSYVAFSELNITIDSKPIDSYPVRELDPLTIDKKANYRSINIDERIELEQINEINNKRIIGIGESMHGNNKIKKLANQLILQSAERLNCKLVLLEMPMEKSFAYNRYHY